MKKLLVADLVSIAHRVLQLKDPNDTKTLLQETETLYRKLALLHFFEENKDRLKLVETESDLFFDEVQNENVDSSEIEIKEEESTVDESSTADIDSTKIETEKEEKTEVTNINENNTDTVEIKNEIEEQPKAVENSAKTDNETQNNLHQPESTFEFTPSIEETTPSIEEIDEKIEEIEAKDPIEDDKKAEETANNLDIDPVYYNTGNDLFSQVSVTQQPQAPRKTINDSFNQTITLDLNDRIALTSHLFDGSTSDLSRVISQINSFASFEEAKNFIYEFVKPEYNNWEGKIEYENRLFELIKKRFS